MNERLRTAIERADITIDALATAVEVDPKTVHRWIGGRVPHPQSRFAIAKKLGTDAEYLWPGLDRKPDPFAGEIVGSYPYRSDVPTGSWWDLITRAETSIDLLGYTLYFLPMQHPRLVETLAEKCAAGVKVRAVIADPESRHVADRDLEEDLALTLAVRIQTSLKLFAPLLGRPGFELRCQDVPLYNSVFRFDDQMYVTPHLYATPGASAPLLHLRRLGAGGMFDRFAGHVDAIWATTTPLKTAVPA